jgi:hypothetical protein
VSSTGDLNLCSVLTMVCGTSSWFVQVIVVPTGTEVVPGLKEKLSFDLLHDLMDVAVQHGNRAEALQLREQRIYSWE